MNKNNINTMGKTKLIFFVALLFGLMFNFVSAATINIGDYSIPVKQNSCYNIPFGCDNCTWVNLTITYPNGSIIVSEGEMTSIDGFHYNYSFCDTDTLGKYWVTYHYDEDGTYLYTDMNWFEVTSNGFIPDIAKAIIQGSFLFLLFGISVFFIILSYKTESPGLKVFFLFLSFLLIMSCLILSSIAAVETSVYENFKSAITIFIFAFGLILFVLFAYIMIEIIKATLNSMKEDKGYEVNL